MSKVLPKNGPPRQRPVTSDIIDSNCGLGHVSGKATSLRTAAELLAAMDRLGIARSLVHSVEAVKGHWRYGNARLMRNIAGQKRLLPCWVVAPGGSGGGEAQLVETMNRAGVRAARICPKSQWHLLTPAVCGPLLSALARAHLPLIIDQEIYGWGDTLNWSAVSSIAAAFGELRIIVPGCVLGASRNLWPHFARHENLYLDMGAFQEPHGLASFVADFGPHRAVYGSYFPHRGQEISLGLLHGRQLSPPARAAVAGGNLQALLEGRAPPPVRSDVPASCDLRVPRGTVDVHVHVGYETMVEQEFAPEQAIVAFDAWGVQCGVVSHMAAVLSGDVEQGNDELLAACRKHRGRLYGWAAFDAAQVEPSLRSCRKLLRDRSIVGFKIHQSTDERLLSDPVYEPMLEIAHRRGLPILVHENQHDKWESTLETIAKKWPQAQVLHAHHGGTADAAAANRIAELLAKFPNLWYETSTSFAPPDAVGQVVRAGGGKRLCFGSDLGFMDNDGQVGKVLFADLTPAQRADVFRHNARRLIARLGPGSVAR